jgi:hypothetical protein
MAFRFDTDSSALTRVTQEMSSAYARAYGPMIRLLSTSAALTLVAGMDPSSRSIAQRIAHDLYVYHRLDSEILEPHDALERTARGLVRGNVVVIGGPKENRYTEWLIAKKRIPRAWRRRFASSIWSHSMR